ncbi:cation-translocating P-type ATPase [Fundidesulfovibrio terrae]|uniref:cation-translocating P-type ATPase n=1 Tax=Fundidesulfovibrio terrae TaxID=2922866 RepID=UPI001FAF8BBE|nr:cation-translocating P-type ATPase [Fundidesulfovibrio terrae]
MPREAFDISAYPGLTGEEARKRLRGEGPNEIPSPDKRCLASIVLEVLREPMFLLLMASGTIYLLLGEKTDAAMLLGFVCITITITVFQERKTERALEALRDLASPRALVVRDGQRKRIPGREVVRGDVIVVAEGDRVPADARLLMAMNLSADESMLTGESVPVRKPPSEAPSGDARPGGDDIPFLFSGSLIVKGLGLAEVTATGPSTEMGRIGKALSGVKTESTMLQKETGKIVRAFAAAGLVLCGAVVVVYALTRGSWLGGFLAGITLAMSVLPEEFPVILTIFLALGAWRMSKRNVLTRRMPVLEMLGAATVLCVDKTGTLTQNRMAVSQLRIGGESLDLTGYAPKLPDQFHRLVEYALLASQRDPFDPMEKAIRELGLLPLAGTEHLHDDWTLVQEYPLSCRLLAMSHVWRSPDGREYVIAAKGAPEAIAELCHLPEDEREELAQRVEAMASGGLRVLGVSEATFSASGLPEDHHDFSFSFLGLIGLHDPIRPAVPAAVRECYGAGIRIIMITGDYPGTARNIAAQVGLVDTDGVLVGQDLEKLDDGQLARQLDTVSIFARAVPEQKLRVVNVLKSSGEVVAMTGDGVNDAPALKSAHIGIAMGGRGTDVAREASSLVLLDDDFSSIVEAVRMGRRIFDNIRKAMAYTLAVHVPIAGLSLIPVFFADWPLVLLPVHIVFLEMIIDPACSFVFEAEPEEEDIMRRPPRDPACPLFDRETVLLALLQGVSVLVIVLAVLFFAVRDGHTQEDSRTLAFSTLVVANIALILTNRSWNRSLLSILKRPNRAFWWVLGGAAALLATAVYTPVLRGVFHFEELHARDVALCLSAGAASVLWFEVVKRLRNKPGNGRACGLGV